ncbi:MAG: hypothetical protein OQL11_00090 [Gammaproteobacteria bacterium]|nr:hypothetical protein [Gammaproteobacteria bacterium]
MVHLRIAPLQKLYHLGTPGFPRMIHGDLPASITQIDIRPLVNESPHQFRLAAPHRKPNRQIATEAWTIDVSAACNQKIHNIAMAHQNRQFEGSALI